MRRYTADHEWLEPREDGSLAVGITAYATEQLGDIVFVELPEIGREVTKGEEIVTIESVKAASDIVAPLDGRIVAVNERIVEDPALVNADPLEGGWFFRIAPAGPFTGEGFLDEAGYAKLTG